MPNIYIYKKNVQGGFAKGHAAAEACRVPGVTDVGNKGMDIVKEKVGYTVQ